MNKLPPGPEPYDDADERYRRASALDPSRPGAAVRRAVLEHAAQLAAARSRLAAAPASVPGERRASRWRRRWWRPAAFAGVAAAALVGLVLAPHWLAPRVERDGADRAPAAAIPPSAALAPFTAPPAPVSPSAAARLLGRAPAPAPAPAKRAAAQSLAGSRAQGEGDGEALRQAAASGDVPQLQSLQAGMADIDARDARGRTALMRATLGGHAGSVTWLLAHGADPNAADADGTTPLQAAVAARQPAIAAALRHYGAH
jgi:ankyrin repeat protein